MIVKPGKYYQLMNNQSVEHEAIVKILSLTTKHATIEIIWNHTQNTKYVVPRIIEVLRSSVENDIVQEISKSEALIYAL